VGERRIGERAGSSSLTWDEVPVAREQACRIRRAKIVARVAKATRRLFAYILLVSIVLSMAFPLFWMTLSSFKPDKENYGYPPTFLPHIWTLENYLGLLKRTAFGLWFRNSLMVSLVTTFTAIVISSLAAYSLSRFRYRFFEAFARVILFAYMVPNILLVIPIFKIVWSLRMGNTLQSLLLVYNAFLIPYGLWTLRSYFAGIPHEIEEAALIDGATRWKAFYSVVLPQALPGIISTALFAFHVAWNEYLYASVLLWASSKMTLSAGVATLIGETEMYSWGVLMAAGVLVTVPVIFLFSFLQQYLIAGWGGGAVKG
jgi:multiple sugar transport system permease protein